jgi:hypothetical protein
MVMSYNPAPVFLTYRHCRSHCRHAVTPQKLSPAGLAPAQRSTSPMRETCASRSQLRSSFLSYVGAGRLLVLKCRDLEIQVVRFPGDPPLLWPLPRLDD